VDGERRNLKSVKQVCAYINDGHKRLSDVNGRDGLHQGLSVLDEREERKTGGGLGDPVQEAIFGTENSSRLHNDLQTKKKEREQSQSVNENIIII